MSPRARRFFGCFLPLVLAIFGCGALLLVGNASRIVVEFRTIPDGGMEPLLRPGWTIMLNNAAYWTDEPSVGDIVSMEPASGGWALRRIAAVPGEEIEVRSGVILVNGRLRDPGYTPIGRGPDAAPVRMGAGEYYLIADNRGAPDSRTWGPTPRRRIFGRAIFQIDNHREFFEVMITPTPGAAATPTAHP